MAFCDFYAFLLISFFFDLLISLSVGQDFFGLFLVITFSFFFLPSFPDVRILVRRSLLLLVPLAAV